MREGKVQIDPVLGVDMREVGWAPSLRYLMRRARVLAHLSPTKKKLNLLEVGCGSGALLFELACSGYDCVGLETSPRALEMANEMRHLIPVFPEITPEPKSDWSAGFDVVLSLDVLEHIEEDEEALGQWVSMLKPGGRLVLSVPAHQRKWNNGDVWAGHFRRYDNEQIRQLAEKVGLSITHLECYGYPLANITEWVGNYYYRYKLRQKNSINKSVATAASGVDRNFYTSVATFLKGGVGKAVIRCALKAQSSRLDEDVGSGYLLVAQKNG